MCSCHTQTPNTHAHTRIHKQTKYTRSRINSSNKCIGPPKNGTFCLFACAGGNKTNRKANKCDATNQKPIELNIPKIDVFIYTLHELIVQCVAVIRAMCGGGIRGQQLVFCFSGVFFLMYCFNSPILVLFCSLFLFSKMTCFE